MEQHVYPTLYCVLLCNNMCTQLSIVFYYGPLCVPYSLFCFIMDHYVYPTLYFILFWTISWSIIKQNRG
jgi:hypothetical protein